MCLFFRQGSMKLASFNINDINRRPSNLLSWLREAEPDVFAFRN
jgi:exonuclease III